MIFLLLPLLLFSLPCLSSPGRDHDWDHHRNCLSSAQASALVSSWSTLESSDPSTPAYSALVDATVTTDITIYDGTISFFFFNDLDAPYTNGKEQFISNFNFSWSDSFTTPLAPSPAIPIIHNCDTITYRWVVNAVVNKPSPETTASIGSPIHYYGTDILTVVPNPKAPNKYLIQHVYKSADWIRLIWQQGEKVCFQRGNPAKPVCADPAPPPGLCFSPLCQA